MASLATGTHACELLAFFNTLSLFLAGCGTVYLIHLVGILLIEACRSATLAPCQVLVPHARRRVVLAVMQDVIWLHLLRIPVDVIVVAVHGVLELADDILLVGSSTARSSQLVVVVNLVVAVERSDCANANVLAARVHYLWLLLSLLAIHRSFKVSWHMHDVFIARIILLAHAHTIFTLALSLRNLSVRSHLRIVLVLLSMTIEHLERVLFWTRAFLRRNAGSLLARWRACNLVLIELIGMACAWRPVAWLYLAWLGLNHVLEAWVHPIRAKRNDGVVYNVLV